MFGGEQAGAAGGFVVVFPAEVPPGIVAASTPLLRSFHVLSLEGIPLEGKKVETSPKG